MTLSDNIIYYVTMQQRYLRQLSHHLPSDRYRSISETSPSQLDKQFLRLHGYVVAEILGREMRKPIPVQSKKSDM